MNSLIVQLILAACALHGGSSFSSPPPSRPSTTARRTPLYTADVRSSDATTSTAAKPSPPPAPDLTVYEQRQLDIIREEIVGKYIALGHSEDHAGREVNYFLEDAERSAQYVEMRRLAMARGNDLGIENIVQFAATSMAGALLSMALNASQNANAGMC